MANYGVLYVFRFESANKTNIEIQILKKDYSGARTYRSLGRAPILKREKSGCVHGSSLELYAECQVDGEFASLYTSSADEYKVEVYKIDEFLGDTIMRRVWTGFVSPELYSEPDIAPPYDVQIIATDGLGELKNYVFEARGLHSVQDHLEYMLGHTGLSQEFNVVSFMAGDSGTVPITDVTVSLDHMAGESCYDVLKAVLDSFHAEIACQDGYWMIWRETDLVNLTSQVEVAEFGSQTKADWWPVGQLSTVIEPAKKRVTVISENAYKDNVLKNVPFHADGATYDSEEKAFVLSTSGTSVFKTLNFGTEVGYKLSLTVTARNVGSGDEGQPIGIKVKIGGRSYIVGDTFWLREKTDGKTSWTNTEGVIEKMLEAPSASDSAKDAQTIALELPLYSYSNRVYHYATSVEVTIFNVDGDYPIHVYDVTLSKLDQIKGYKAVLEIDNGAREEADETTLIIADDDRIPAAADIFMNGIALNASGEPISSWASGRMAAMGYLAFMSRDYALSVALPRMKVQGVLNVPDSALITPVLFLRDNTYYFPEIYDYDLLNDELSVSLVSIPTAQIEVVSEEVTEIVDPFQSRPGGSAGGGSSSGGSSGGGEGSGEDSLIFEFTYDTTTSKATAEMVAALAEAISENKLILCNGRTYKFILEQDGMYGLVSDAYMDIMDGKLKASVLAVMSSSYDVQLMEEEVPVGTEITESTIAGWGFTKNAGTITGIKMNGVTKGTSGVVDLGNVLTEHQKLKTINNQSILGEGNIEIQSGGATPRVEMTAASAAIEPNKFYVWPMMDALDLTLGAEQSGVMNRYLFQFRNPKAGLTVLTLPDDITWSDDTELDENGMPVMEAAAYYRIEIIEGLASLKKWKLVYINFADAEVERALMSNGVGDGIGITKRDAKAVTSIGAMFVNNEVVESFEEFEFFTGITEITGAPWEDGGFRGCTNLKKIKLPQSLQTIFAGAIPGQYSSTGAFKDCESLEEITIPAGVDTIPTSAFYNCLSLVDVNFDGAVKVIDKYAFAECKNLVIEIPSSVEHIDERAFRNVPMKGIVVDCPNLKYLSGRYVFTRSKIRGVESLGYITELRFQSDPPGYYGNYPTFYGCADMEFINLPDTLTHIGRNMFQGCGSLKSITIPQGVAELSTGTFAECYNLEWMKVEAVTPPALYTLDCIEMTSNYPIYVPNASVEAYKAATNWNSYAHRIRGMQDFILGIVTPQNIRCSSSILTAENAVREKVWSIVGGSEFATITEDGILTILPNASDAEVTIRCTDDNGNIAEKTINVTYNAPLMYLPFDEDFVDAMGNASLLNAVECSIDESKGVKGASMNRPYTAGGLSYQPSFNASFADKSFSVDVWVYLPSNAPNTYLGIAGKRTNASLGASWSFGIKDRKVNIGLSANGGGFTNDFYTDAVIPLEKWTRVTMVRDYERGEYRVYVDTSLVATFGANYALYNGSDGLAVGNYHTDPSNDYFYGNLDEFRIYEGCIFD